MNIRHQIKIFWYQLAAQLIRNFVYKQYNLPAFIFLVALTCLPTWSSYVISRASANGGNAVFLSQILNGHIQGWSLSIPTDSARFFLTSTFLVVSTNKHVEFETLLEMRPLKICSLVNISNQMKFLQLNAHLLPCKFGVFEISSSRQLIIDCISLVNWSCFSLDSFECFTDFNAEWRASRASSLVPSFHD